MNARFPRTRPLLAAIAFAAAVLLAVAAPAEAGSDKDLAGVLAGIKKAHKGDEDGTLDDTLARAVTLHNGSDVPAARQKLQAALGGLLKAKDAGSGRSKAATALGKLNDPAGAYKVLKAVLPGKGAEVAPYQLRALEAVAALVPQAAPADLGKVLAKSSSRQAVTATMRTLACYGDAGPVRVKVLQMLLESGEAWKADAAAGEKKLAKRKPPKEPKNPKKAPKEPRPKKGDVKAKQAVDDWQAYAPVLLESLNKLTGSTRPSVDDWLAIRQDKKAKLEDLFTTKS